MSEAKYRDFLRLASAITISPSVGFALLRADGQSTGRWDVIAGAGTPAIGAKVPAPPATGTYKLQSVDGVLSWVTDA